MPKWKPPRSPPGAGRRSAAALHHHRDRARMADEPRARATDIQLTFRVAAASSRVTPSDCASWAASTARYDVLRCLQWMLAEEPCWGRAHVRAGRDPTRRKPSNECGRRRTTRRRPQPGNARRWPRCRLAVRVFVRGNIRKPRAATGWTSYSRPAIVTRVSVSVHHAPPLNWVALRERTITPTPGGQDPRTSVGRHLHGREAALRVRSLAT